MTKEIKSPIQEAKEFVSSGKLRDALNQEPISEEAIEKIIDACSFVLRVW